MLIALWLTLKVALLATLIAGLAGIGLAWWLARSKFPGKGILDAILVLPMVLPPTVIGYYLIVLIGRNGALGRHLHDWFGINLMFTWQGAVIAASVVSLPLVYKGAYAAFEEVDGRFAHAARTLGAGEFELFMRVALPLAIRGIAAGLMLAFARAMGEFGATLMIAGNLPGKTQTLSIAVYEAVQAGEDGRALCITLTMSVVCMAVLVVSGRLLQARH
ncbi:molybdate ABC transporter permease subunit [Verminephrobacter aporrectodeae]|uniref:Molybdenum transport system permease n=1 Tax=Verminephrobacter aporrectodeae subsp. tuberculatae TaxID=1110392 RepID=A0ABT3L057_9BURK|nr:molybdate ABC transporter permease subunit [Verminephrobacter aporrectodeae]MCW5219689.1 molybdate ABC transporter permease subunit [Verminephrobacter aporrectodeae subsp. tuberculatae]MCW5258610.1 molybdate ABC transporter permease subunit [Verminephrobacter aporrectodeae subsp. tuberculatae]MCW5287613.1 molybdate ABC transporter permease subunit [Verminephrobacter aporrectodeae subsp. tuberculatae]MCW5323450.1 molybdate ABC transporter permease subunit [Verminephrobacter aporrectodeae subs